MTASAGDYLNINDDNRQRVLIKNCAAQRSLGIFYGNKLTLSIRGGGKIILEGFAVDNYLNINDDNRQRVLIKISAAWVVAD